LSVPSPPQAMTRPRPFVGRRGLRSPWHGRAGGLGEIGVDAAGSKNMARRIERATAGVSPPAGVGIVNQQSVAQI